jgi:hypothetical protein
MAKKTPHKAGYEKPRAVELLARGRIKILLSDSSGTNDDHSGRFAQLA